MSISNKKLKYDLSTLLTKSLLSFSTQMVNYNNDNDNGNIRSRVLSELTTKYKNTNQWKKFSSNHWELKVDYNIKDSYQINYDDGNPPLIVTSIQPYFSIELGHLIKVESEISDEYQVFNFINKKKSGFWRREVSEKVTTKPNRLKVSLDPKARPDVEQLKGEYPFNFHYNISNFLRTYLHNFKDVDLLILDSTQLSDLGYSESPYTSTSTLFTKEITNNDNSDNSDNSHSHISFKEGFKGRYSHFSIDQINQLDINFQSDEIDEKYWVISMGSLSTILNKNEYQKLLNKVDAEKLKHRLKKK